MSGLSHDGFLDGRVMVWQPVKGYRAATDPVFLAAACPAKPGERVLELGCGVGVASLCLAARVPGAVVHGVERQAVYADLARLNGLDVTLADLVNLPAELKQQSFDHVMMNPPYFPSGGGTAAADSGREAALREETPLKDWVATARLRLKPKGWLTLIHLAERLPDVLASLEGFGSISCLPLAPRIGRPAGRVLIRARKGGQGAFALLAPLLLHEGERHGADGDDYAPVARAVLRDCAALPWG